MKLLALDTATEACSAALLIDGEIIHRYQLAPREHTRLILAMAEEILAEAGQSINQLDCLAFGRGPGSFTGVRIATGVVQGMAFAGDLPVVPVSTLASVAQLCHEQHQQEHVIAALDARMGGIYWGRYSLDETGLMQLQGSERVSPPDQLATTAGLEWVMAGSACGPYKIALMENPAFIIGECYAELLPHAATMARLAAHTFEQGGAVEAAKAQPVYLRDDVAKKASAQ